jgi:hypothetical protein
VAQKTDDSKNKTSAAQKKDEGKNKTALTQAEPS